MTQVKGDQPLVTNAAIQPGNIKYFKITKQFSGGEKTVVDITGAVSEFLFYESVLSNTFTATVIIIDTGFAARANDNKIEKSGGIIANLQLSGGERVDFEVEDNNFKNVDNKDSVIKIKNGMYINRIRDLSSASLKNIFAIDLVPYEFINNEKLRVTERYDGQPSDSVKKIIKKLQEPAVGTTNVIDSEEPEIDSTSVAYNFIGNDRKPLYICSWLATKSIPAGKSDSGASVIGKQAGYFFYQTRKKFHFVAIDNRLKGLGVTKRAKRYIYNATGRINEINFDQNILSYTVRKTVDVGKDLALGTYNNRSIFFDFLSMNYRVRSFDVVNDSEKDLNTANTYINLPTRSITDGPSRLMTHVLDVGTLPKGINSSKQLEEWKKDITEPNLKADDTMVQSIMRYNLLFSHQTNIIVPGDFSIEAGDIVRCVFRGLNPESPDGDYDNSGLYMVASVCHRMTPTETFSSLDLIKDSKSESALIVNTLASASNNSSTVG